jgi:hypothetical protein
MHSLNENTIVLCYKLTNVYVSFNYMYIASKKCSKWKWLNIMESQVEYHIFSDILHHLIRHAPQLKKKKT